MRERSPREEAEMEMEMEMEAPTLRSRVRRAGPRAAGLAFLLLVAAPGCRSVPTAGTGDVAFRLLWQGESDLDLHVEDPAGEHVFYGQRSSESGGRLDVDCNAGTGRLCPRPIENVFWPEGTAPAGRYRVWVRAHAVYPAEAPLACELLILQGESVRIRLAARLVANGDLLGPFTLDFPSTGAAAWSLTPSEDPVPDASRYSFRPPPAEPAAYEPPPSASSSDSSARRRSSSL